jgi:L-lactate dehydrogenase complex protein LldE
MRIGLFVPCYVDQFVPKAAASTLKLLLAQGFDVEVPMSPVCCGQVNANSGYPEQSIPIQKNFAKIFAKFDFVVCPSGSCTSMIRHHVDAEAVGNGMNEIQKKTFELCEFLYDVVGLDKIKIEASLNKRVGIHTSCHGHRELRLGQSSENMTPRPSKLGLLLDKVPGLTQVEATRKDECCGFGGSFCVTEEAISSRMGQDRIGDFASHNVDIITSADVSCLMHLRGIAERQNRKIAFCHIAEILAGDMS